MVSCEHGFWHFDRMHAPSARTASSSCYAACVFAKRLSAPSTGTKLHMVPLQTAEGCTLPALWIAARQVPPQVPPWPLQCTAIASAQTCAMVDAHNATAPLQQRVFICVWPRLTNAEDAPSHCASQRPAPCCTQVCLSCHMMGEQWRMCSSKRFMHSCLAFHHFPKGSSLACNVAMAPLHPRRHRMRIRVRNGSIQGPDHPSWSTQCVLL